MIPEGYIPYESEIDVGLIGAYVIVIFDKETKNPLARVEPVKGKKEVRITGSIPEAMVSEILDLFSHPVDYVFHFSSEGKSFSGSGKAEPYTREFFLAGVDEFNRRFDNRGFRGEAYVSPREYIRIVYSESQLKEMACELQIPYVDISCLQIDYRTATLISKDITRKKNLLCIACIKDTIIVAMEDPADLDTINLIEEKTGLRVKPVLSDPEDIRSAIGLVYPDREAFMKEMERRTLQKDAEFMQVPYVDLATIRFDKELRETARIITKPMAEKLRCVVIGRYRDKLTVAMEIPADKTTRCIIKLPKGLDIKPVYSTGEDIEEARKLVYFGIKENENTNQEQLTEEIYENNLIKAAEVMKIPYVRLSDISIDREIALIIPSSMALRYGLVCIGRKDRTLTIAMIDPLDVFAIDDIRFRTGYDVESVLCSYEDIEKAQRLIYE